MMNTINTLVALEEPALTIDEMIYAIEEGKSRLAAIGIIPCVCCRRPFSSRGRHNVVCDPCRSAAPEF